MLQFK